MIKINLGSGPASASGWKNYDWGLLPIVGKYRLTPILIKLGVLTREYDWQWPRINLVNIKKGLPDKDKSVDYIYCSHVLEHFEKYEALKILKECQRVLKNEGRLRIVLPDVKKIISDYQNADDFCRQFYGYNKDVSKLTNMFVRGHQWMYDIDSARELLSEAGFKNIKVSKYKEGTFPDLDKLDLEPHRKISLYLEAGGRRAK